MTGPCVAGLALIDELGAVGGARIAIICSTFFHAAAPTCAPARVLRSFGRRL